MGATASGSGEISARRKKPRESRSGQFPKEYKRLLPPAKFAWLKTVGKEMVRAGRLQQKQVEAEANRLEGEARRVSTQVATPALLDDWHRGNAFPPKSDATPMRRARIVVKEPEESKVLWPFYYFTSSGHPWELYLATLYAGHRLRDEGNDGRSSTASPTAKALQAAADANAQVVETKLDPEDGEALLEEIKSVHDGTWQPVDLNGNAWGGV